MNFKEKVYKIVKKIPRGKVLTYKEVAERAGRPKAYRVVGNILQRHSIKGLPCHRVIRSDGKVGDYQWGRELKIKKLKREGIKILKNGRVID